MSGTRTCTSPVRSVEANLPMPVRRLNSNSGAHLYFYDVLFQALHECDNVITFLFGNL
jgi:hypothetical protein